jgi:primosomal protein N' (replication factor Y)
VLRQLARAPEGLPLQDLSRRAKVSSSPVHTLAKEGWIALSKETVHADPLLAAAVAPHGEPANPPTPNPAQALAVEVVSKALAQGEYHPFLLLGVTGSGKTEVYLRAIEACRATGRQAIVLVPEIALTPQTVRRFRARVEKVAVLHSAMTEADRAAAWRSIRAGAPDVVIGPRSAVFAPVPRLGLLVLDEEHETSFKQQNAPRYHARDVGLVRAREAGAVVVLGSATPSLESYRNAMEGRFTLLELPDRVEDRPLPPVRVVDLRTDGESRGAGRHLGRSLVERLRATLEAGGQAILFLNRRGYSTSVACPRCGLVLRCPDCDVSFTYHRAETMAICHLCGHEERPPTACPDCAFPSLKYRGAGTENVEAEVLEAFPDVPLARMDSDTMTDRGAYEATLDRFARGEVRILLGTQMIAKGLHFPAVTLVGVVSADTSLALPDFRAAERTFALIAQVAGRAGRGDLPGEVLVQTLHPQEPSILLATQHAYAEFARAELEERRTFGYPPYRRLLRVLLRGKSKEAVVERGGALVTRLDRARIPGVEWLGPATPLVHRMQGLHRRHLLVKAESPRGIHAAMSALRAGSGPTNGVEEHFDVDPVGLF